MALTAKQWGALELEDDVVLVLGWREGRRKLQGRPMPVDGEVAKEMRAAAQETLERLGKMQRRPYAGNPAIDPGQFLALSTDDLPHGPHALSDEAETASQLLAVIEAVAAGDADDLTRHEVKGRQWLYYAVLGRVAGEPIAFVRQWNPQRGLTTGRLTTRMSNRLVKFDDPVFIFDFRFQVIVTGAEIAILDLTGFDRVFADVDPTGAQVPENVGDIGGKLGTTVGKAAAKRLEEVCAAKPSYAKRLRRLAAAKHLDKVTSEALGDALERHGLERDLFGSNDEIEIASDDDVGRLLDVLEELYYEGDFSGEHLRADRVSPRP